MRIPSDFSSVTDDAQTPTKPRLPRAEIFVDGTNFDIAARKLVHSSIDMPKFARTIVHKISQSHLLVKLHYCTAPAGDPTPSHSRFEQAYFERLRESQSVDLVLGRHQATGQKDRNGRRSFTEKHTDVNVAILMMEGACDNRYDTAVIISGDTDMVPVMKRVRERGKRVAWCHFPSQQMITDLEHVSDEQYLITEQLLRTMKYSGRQSDSRPPTRW